MAATTQEEILSGILPKVIIEKVTINNIPESSGLKITLNLTIKETLENNKFGTWFKDVNILKYIAIQVVQSKNKMTTDVLSYSNDMIQLVTLERGFLRPRYTGAAGGVEDMRHKAAGYVIETNSLAEIEATILDNIDTQIINLYSNNDVLQNSPSYRNSDGNLIYEIPYELTFELQDSNPQHLAYFAVSRIDLQRLRQDFNIDYDSLEALQENGRVSSEIVIDNYTVVDTSYAYIDKYGDIWDGPVHLNEQNEWKSGDDDNQTSINLTQIEINNSKVQDFRNVAEIERLILDFNDFSVSDITFYSAFNKSSKISSTNFNYIPENPEPIFSDLFVSNEGEINKILFAIDFNNAMKQYSPLGYLFDSRNDVFKQQVFQNSKILNLDITFKRIQRNLNKKNDIADYGTKDFESGNSLLDRQITLISSKDKVWNSFINVTDGLSIALKEENIFTNLNNIRNQSLRYFSCVNGYKVLNQYGGKVSGLYQYGINLQIEDGTIKYIISKISELSNSKNRLIAYYNQTTVPSMKTGIGSVSYGFDVVSNRMSNELIEIIEDRYRRSDEMAPWISEPSIFVDILNIFSENVFEVQSLNKYVTILQTFLNPRSGNPSSINRVIELYDYFISSLSRLVKINPNTLISEVDNITGNLQTNSGLIDLEGKNASEKESRIFKISKTFDQIIDSEVNSEFGVDYLDDGLNLDISRINADIFKSRIEGEVRKYYNIMPNRMPLQTSDYMSYISPVKFIISNTDFITSPNWSGNITNGNNYVSLFEGDIFENASRLLTYIAETKLQNIVLKQEGERVYSQNRINTYRRYTGTKILTHDLKQLHHNYGGVSYDYVKNNNPIPSEYSNLPEDSDEQPFLRFLLSTTLPISRTQTTSFTFSNNSIEKNNKFLYNYNNIEPIKKLVQTNETFRNSEFVSNLSNLPYQLLGLPVANQNYNEFISTLLSYPDFKTSIKNNIINYFYFENMMKIEYLDNFFQIDAVPGQIVGSATSYKVNVKAPKWKTLSVTTYSPLPAGTYILCRLTPYQNDYFGISVNSDISESTYNKYFLLETGGIFNQAPSTTLTSMQARQGNSGQSLQPPSLNNTGTRTIVDLNSPNQSAGVMSGLFKNIVDTIRTQIDNVSIGNISNPVSIKDIPKSIQVSIIDNSGNKNLANITNKPIVISDPNLTRTMLKAHSISLDIQTKKIKNTSTTNNIINNVKIKNAISKGKKR